MTVVQDLDLLNVNQTIIYLGIAKSTLAAWRVKKEGPNYVKIGSNIYYRKKLLLEYTLSKESNHE